MAQLKNTVVSGSLRATDSLLTLTLQTKIIKVPATAGGTDYSTGANKYVLLSNGSSAYWGTATAITEVGTISTGTWQGTTIGTAYGGTGNTSYTANRLVWTETATKFTAGYHYASSTKVGICYTSEPSYNFAVSGTSYFNGNTTHNGIDYFANGTTYYINNSGDANLRAVNVNSALTMKSGNDLNFAATSSSSDDTGDIVWFYGNGNEQARIWMGSGWTTKGAPCFREYKSDGTSLYSGWLVLGDGTGASGSWGISVTGNAATATTLQTARNIWGQSFNGSSAITGKFLMNGDDGSLAFYTVDGNHGCGNETVVIQSCFDGQDPQTSGYTSSYEGRCNIALQPRGGQVYIGKVPPNGNTAPFSLYLNKGLDLPENKWQINFRQNDSYRTGFSYQTNGNEALVLMSRQSVTSFIFANGVDPASASSSQWTGITGPGLQIKSNCVRIGGLWGNNVTPDYKLRVDGSTLINREQHSIGASAQCGIMPLGILGFKNGYPMFTDPEFASGTNSVDVYNNSGNGSIVITRTTMTNGNKSGYVLQIAKSSTGASPGLGGFVQGYTSKANAIFVQIFRAKIPAGYKVNNAENSQGANAYISWLTDQEGTGKWEWYARLVHCGDSGTFSSGGHVYLSKSNSSVSDAVTWYLSYCNCFDVTNGAYDGLRTRYSDYSDSSGTSSSCSGNAATATRINGNLAQATSDLSRNIWVSSTTSADGIPNYVSTFTMNPSTKTLHIPSGGRIDANGGALYLGNSNNASWVYMQDVASQSGSDKWAIHQTNGNAEFYGTLTAGSATVKGNLSVSTNNATGGGIILADDGDIVDLNDGYCSMRFSYGVQITSGNRGGSSVIKLRQDGWIQLDTWNGLYSPNNSAHFYPNNVSSYGTWTINGSRNGYYGINLGPGTGYMTLMCDGSGNGGLFCEGNRWPLYYNRGAGRLGLMDSSTSSGYSVQVNGSLYVTSTVYAPSTWYTDSVIYCHGLWANRTDGEKQVGVDNGTAGNLYLYSNNSTKGIYSSSGYRTGSVIYIDSNYCSFEGNAWKTGHMYTDNSTFHIGTGGTYRIWLYGSTGAAQFTNRVWINYNTDVSPGGDDGAFVVGPKTGKNIAMDGNEIMARNNYSTSELFLNADGGTVKCGGQIWASSLKNPNGAGAIVSHNNYSANMQGDGNFVVYNSSGGALWSSFGSSTRLIKENIIPVQDYELNNFKHLRVVSFTFKKEAHMVDTSKQYGLIAEEVLPLYPNLVTIPEGYDESKFDINKGMAQPLLSVKYTSFVPLLIRIVQLQQERIEKLEAIVNQLSLK